MKSQLSKVSAIKSGGESADGRARLVSYIAGRVGRDGASKVRIFFAISFSYILFWGPLFTVTLANWSWEWKDAKNSISHEVMVHQSQSHHHCYLRLLSTLLLFTHSSTLSSSSSCTGTRAMPRVICCCVTHHHHPRIVQQVRVHLPVTSELIN